MTNTFLNRVSAERRVLSVVNKRLSRVNQLTGLSRASISLWRANVGRDRTASINPILISVAEQCQRLSDRSNETFLPMDQIETDKIEAQLIELKKELDMWL
jgi:hypothetical protein